MSLRTFWKSSEKKKETGSPRWQVKLGAAQTPVGEVCPLEGWLWKKGIKRHTWKKRYSMVVVPPGESSGPVVHLVGKALPVTAGIPVAGSVASAVGTDADMHGRYRFEIVSSDQKRPTRLLATETAEDRERWIRAIAGVQVSDASEAFRSSLEVVGPESDSEDSDEGDSQIFVCGAPREDGIAMDSFEAEPMRKMADAEDDDENEFEPLDVSTVMSQHEALEGLRSKPPLRHLTDFSSHISLSAIDEPLSVATLNIENAVRLGSLVKKKCKQLVRTLRQCGVIMLQEFTAQGGDVLLAVLNQPSGDKLLPEPPHFACVYCARIALLYDQRRFEVQTAQAVLLTKVDKLTRAEKTFTHIKDRYALHVRLRAADGDCTEFISMHLDAISQRDHPGHHRDQLQQIMRQVLGSEERELSHRCRESYLHEDGMKPRIVLAGDMNYRADGDGSGLFDELFLSALSQEWGLRDVCRGKACVSTPTHRMSEFHEGGVAKSVAKAFAQTSHVARVLGLGPARLDIMVSNASCERAAVVRAPISDHDAVVAVF